MRDECSLARHPFDCPRTPLTVSSYVGVLHEINSENHTVALERVTSFGTEDRKAPAETIPGSDQVYEYIVFRGSDVKELNIVAPPAAPKENEQPQMPNDPAILGVRTSHLPSTVVLMKYFWMLNTHLSKSAKIMRILSMLPSF